MKRAISFYQKASQNLILIHHLRGLIERLKKEGPEVLFLRGVSLLGDVYPSLGDREMLDVDILVRERDLPRLKEFLTTMGLEEIEPGTFDKTGLSLDIHTSFLNLSRTILERSCLKIFIENVFRRSITKELDGMEIRIPCPEHLFISTAVHLQSHSFCWEKRWEDLVRIKRYYGLSDEGILTEAKRVGAERTLYYLSFLHPDLLPAWEGKLSLGERLVLRRIRAGMFNRNFGDLLFLFQSKRRGEALKEIFFSKGISFKIIADRLKKSLLLLGNILLRSKS